MNNQPQPELEACRSSALAAVEKAIGANPDDVEAAALEMTRALVRLRDALIAADRSSPSAPGREALARANSILSLVVSVQYPMHGVQQEKLKKAREALSALALAAQ